MNQSKKLLCVILCGLFFTSVIQPADLTLSQKASAFIATMYKKVLGVLNSEAQRAQQWLWDEAQKIINRHNPYKNQKAYVRNGTDICSLEKSFIAQRSAYALACLKQFLSDDTLTQATMPRIACCASGGGFRATVSSLGSMEGMQDIGLLDGVLYMGGISGGTWFLGPWTYGNMTLNEYKNNVHLSFENILGTLEKDIVHASLMTKKIFGQPMSIIDLYGALVARTLLKKFGSKSNSITISQCTVNPATHPYPILSAMRPLNQWNIDYCRGYQWFEITPHEVGSNDIYGFQGAYVPVWAFGRTFKNGVSTDYAPEQHLGHYLAVCGSAFEAAMRDVLPQLAQDLLRVEKDLLEELPGLIRLAPASIKHFLPTSEKFAQDLKNSFEWLINKRNSPAQFHSYTPLIKKPITLVDAGVACNIPIQPMLRKKRNIDVLIVFDASSPIGHGHELRLSEFFAQSRGLPFPTIDYNQVGEQLINVFDDGDDKTPVIIYVPLKTNPSYSSSFDVTACENTSYCATFNVHYTHDQVKELAGLMRCTIKQHANVIRDALKKVVARKKMR